MPGSGLRGRRRCGARCRRRAWPGGPGLTRRAASSVDLAGPPRVAVRALLRVRPPVRQVMTAHRSKQDTISIHRDVRRLASLPVAGRAIDPRAQSRVFHPEGDHGADTGCGPDPIPGVRGAERLNLTGSGAQRQAAPVEHRRLGRSSRSRRGLVWHHAPPVRDTSPGIVTRPGIDTRAGAGTHSRRSDGL
jgi:hypothetical protein